MEAIFLQPVFQERIWGGVKLKTMFGYELPSAHTGECWAVSAHPNGPSIVQNGPFAGQTLGELWTTQPQLFGSQAERFPLLTKLLDASDDLSVQVHPADDYARRHEGGELGKTECWYIVAADPGAQIIFGHQARTREQYAAMIEAGRWDELLSYVPVQAGDFFYVPSGTLHALGKGVVVLETQQSSDTTYRVYDYDRTDAQGNRRELHLEKAIDVTTVPHEASSQDYRVERREGTELTTYVSNRFFTVQEWQVSGPTAFPAPERYLIVSVLDGEGELQADGKGYSLRKGEHFILPLGFGAFTLDGRLELIVSHE
ncbi:mannose-6-phosphate isomerase, class I [Paenibacillus athensensis]|uniref:Mannose-6-phosphate isomerase n=1 Tax=Paenibacillus athensensis TaxID=1967502 RepID=A0A4Y8PY47_9BACL|nr:mannose-6-phosphate isomerase, class I [Paenibacillus athensensis]MCD1259652.1 mannose-6-phosphate isomerase, class I [Paenibacillus athensensis]